MLNPKITKGQTKSYILTVMPATTVHVTDRMGKVTLEKLSNVAEFPGQVGEGSGWKCVGSLDSLREVDMSSSCRPSAFWYNGCMKRIATAVFAVLALASGWADAEFSVGQWNVVFADEGERLVLTHADGFAEVAGTLSFTGPAKVTGAGMGADGSTARWRVASSRDGFPNRLALVDTRDNVNGYIAFQPDGEGVSLLVYHRTAFAPCAHRLAKLEHILRPGRLEGES